MKLGPRAVLQLATIGIFIEVAAGYWDVYSHQLQPIDPLWNPAHLTLYGGIGIALGAILLGGRTRGVPAAPPMNLMTIGLLMQLLAGGFNEVWHFLGGPRMTLEPPHVLLVMGMILAAFGGVVGLAGLRGLERLHGDVSLRSDATLLLSFLTIWLLTAGSGIYTAYLLPTSLRGYMLPVVAAITPLVIVPCARVLQRPGWLTLLGCGYAAINWVMLVAYLGVPAYIPWTVPAVAASEGLWILLRRSVAPITSAGAMGLASGLLFYWTFYPFTYEFTTSGGMPLISPGLVAGGLVGGVVAHLIIRATMAWITHGKPAPVQGTTG